MKNEDTELFLREYKGSRMRGSPPFPSLCPTAWGFCDYWRYRHIRGWSWNGYSYLFPSPPPLFFLFLLSLSLPLSTPTKPHTPCFFYLLGLCTYNSLCLEHCLPRNSFRPPLNHCIWDLSRPWTYRVRCFLHYVPMSRNPNSVLILVCPPVSPSRVRIPCGQRPYLICLYIF